jgi:NitT/TauT family transport system permease protein
VAPQTFPSREALRRWPSGLADAALLLGVIGLIALTVAVGYGAFAVFQPPDITPTISLDPAYLPYYLARSTLRMFVALGCSLAFTFAVGALAARNPYAERIIIPALDVLQSVPVLGFLSVTVTLFIALFPGSLLGLEAASIFAIFTGQVWNMTFSFYYSLRALPGELNEASLLYRLSRWQKFWRVGVPFTMIGLIWNTMMSFGGGWFFVSASEAITVLNQEYTLPGIGSYVAEAVKQQDMRALVLAVVAMAAMIVVVDQLLWRPLVSWADKFKFEASASSQRPTSWFYDFMRTATLPRRIKQAAAPLRARVDARISRRRSRIAREAHGAADARSRLSPTTLRWRDLTFNLTMLAIVVVAGAIVVRFVTSQLALGEIAQAFGFGLLTLTRVFVVIAGASLLFIPIGVAIGFSPKLGRIAQPVVQFLASFPATFLFPFATILFIQLHININFGSILLMALGAQWYVMFNVIAGARSIPTEMREMTSITRVRGWHVWRRMILPGIFAAWVTGALTAYGGAFNASIVAEKVTWGDTTLTAIGLGSYIEHATTVGDWPRIVLGVGVMTIYVVLINRLLWRRLYALAERRYSL